MRPRLIMYPLAAALTLAAAVSSCLTADPGSKPHNGQPPERASTAAWADTLEVDVYGVAPAGFDIEYGLAIDLGSGEAVTAGELPPGVYWIAVAVTPCGVLLEDEVLQVGGPGSDTGSGNTAITCGAGWYACCFCQKHNGRTCPVARCRKNGTNEPNGGCQAGGPGATQCSIGVNACP